MKTQQSRHMGDTLNLLKNVYKTTANFIPNGEKINTFPLRSRKDKSVVCQHSYWTSHYNSQNNTKEVQYWRTDTTCSNTYSQAMFIKTVW